MIYIVSFQFCIKVQGKNAQMKFIHISVCTIHNFLMQVAYTFTEDYSGPSYNKSLVKMFPDRILVIYFQL
jgi:hypothetical protein